MLMGLHIWALRFFIAALPMASYAGMPAHQNSVLVLSAESLGYPNLASFYGGFRSTLQKKSALPVRIYSESMDADLFDGPAYRTQMADWYLQKYRDARPDAIVVMGEAPLRFLLESHLWPDVPVYFALVTQNAIKRLALPANMTGQTFALRLDVVVDLAQQIFPGTKRIALVGNRPERDSYRPFGPADIQALEGRVTFLDLRGIRYETVSTQLANLPSDTVVYHTTLNDDGSGRVFDRSVALQALTSVSNRPTLVDTASVVGLGPVGGLVGLPAAQGEQAALNLIKLLQGTPAASMPVEVGKLSPVFDWRQLQRWQVSDAYLPLGSEIRFYQPNVWQRYWGAIVTAMLVIACLSILSASLLVERRRRAVAVTESRRRLAEIAHMNRNATASVYSAAIAHELNQPLAAILSNAEAAEMMLERPDPPVGELREILVDIRRDDYRASELIARMRNLLKPSEAAMQIVDITSLVRDVLKFISSEAELRSAVLTTSFTPEAALVMVDQVQIQQVLINLVLNSLDAMDDTPRSARVITISTALLGKAKVEVTVCDTGSGFDSNIERVFESFFTTKKHGMGLGLSITAAIIESHGGAIEARNVRSGGACIQFQLPVKAHT
jgi:signal transduction histidine kinase